MSASDNGQRDVLDEGTIHIGSGFKDRDRAQVLEALAPLAPHLGRWAPGDVEIDVSVKDRDGKEQRITLRTMLPGLPPLVAVASDPHLVRALSEAKRELIRQIEDQKSTREPKNNRQLRERTIRHLGSPQAPEAETSTGS